MKRAAAIGALLLALGPTPAHAHLVTTGLGPFYDGVSHLALTPEDLLPALTTVSFLVVGGLVAADARLPLAATTTLTTALGLFHGLLNGGAMEQARLGALGLAGIVAAVFVLVAVVAGIVTPLRAPWARVMVRVAGSWIAAIGVLISGWTLRGAS